MSAIANTANTDMVIGLKTQVKSHAGLKNYQEEIAEYNQSCLIDIWKSLTGDAYIERIGFRLGDREMSEPLFQLINQGVIM